jgi:fumarate reductase subunit C
MARAAHPRAMAPSRPGRTRTAPPTMPPQFPAQGRYRSYTLFGATGVLYLLCGFVALRAVWALGDGPGAWQEILSQLGHPLYVLFHAASLAAVVFVGVRFFSLFPKAQPAKIGPAKPPPEPVITAMLYGAWAVVAGGLALVLAGGIF